MNVKMWVEGDVGSGSEKNGRESVFVYDAEGNIGASGTLSITVSPRRRV